MFTRTRTEGSISSNSVPMTETYYWTTSPTTTTASGTLCTYGTKKTTSDVVTKDFHRKVKEGVVINNPFSSVKEFRSYTTGSRVSTYTKTPPPAPGTRYINKIIRVPGNNGNWYRLPTELECPVDVDALRKKASTMALSRIEKPEVEGLAILGELTQTIALLRNPLSALTNFVKKGVQSSRGLRQRDAATALANQHLAIAFGIRPLMHDVENALKAIELKHKTNRKTARGFASAVSETVSTRTYNDGAVIGTITDQMSRSVEVRTGALYDVAIDLGLSKWGFSVSDIPSALWELTPWSFAIDWVSNVGDYISAITPKFGLDVLSQWEVVRTTSHCVSTLGSSLATINPDFTTTGGGDTRTYTVQATDRRPVILYENAGLVFEPSLNTSQLFLSLSLLTQQLSRIKGDIAIPKQRKSLTKFRGIMKVGDYAN